jgi:serine acetyltransferase
MKTNVFDFVRSIAVVLAVFALSFFLTSTLVAPLVSHHLGDYRIIADALVFLLLYGVISAVLMRLILAIKPFVPGEYSMDDSQFTMWKLYSIVYSFGRGALVPFTTVFTKPLIPKLFGAKLGERVALAGIIADAPMVSVGERSILGHNSSILGHTIVSGRIILGRVKIGKGVTVGVNSVIWPNVDIGDGAIVTAGSVVKMGTNIPANELWGGCPARKIKDVTANVPRS